ncbi:gamma-glutamyl-gamma-aminobutyrate hydrolase family protein [Enterococcus faecium]|uniref:Gamma-glutamyl-gamma-aminobutyrate hydrolase family protein n=1 Tax=Enterococcus faecium TaxID=1352 RepID=A0AAW8RKU1_ENTFC|nr:gamma-glutamyl-gamma-aminobutyrate hydrolase family protein [Enterococcus faecium]EIB6811475.1 gamma-glutamyl-gamma-aminobutyrate hydrolase family protein [Enterococcus faecium]EIB6831091.1 gamma-glutamyl-gamma-aminobutyrate hydrolase family protein [Enterococcus faecium]EIJ1813917.1 gamma-glutamyl-gamma-aminobutyrate hydrolase family protein [Enterococcus faecium]EIR3864016.1 gamma-glutamyl-gamma-aminobutyrate hydrolase family protein [Enterococcus faecium]MCD5063179.1 gamma-glutamyl-gamma
MKPIIGIAGNQLIRATDTFQGNQVSYTPQGFVDAVLDAQGLPLILPVMSPDSAPQLIGQIDKLILAGGQDVSPQLYMEDPHPKLTETNIQRDQFEQALILEALKQRKPIFAVCRGLQLLNVVLEGTLYQDLSLYPKWSVKHEQQPTAPQFTTHEKDLSPLLKAIAFSNDGLVEAVQSKDDMHKILGVQWHPELTHRVHPSEQRLFDFFVNEF